MIIIRRIDFIRYSLEDSHIDNFIEEINCLDQIFITRIGDIDELKQQDYRGKRIHIKISDTYGNSLISKIDLGVHKDLSIKQEEYCFEKYIFDDAGMKENKPEDIVRRITATFKDKSYRKKLKTTETNWLNIDSNKVLNEILCFFTKL